MEAMPIDPGIRLVDVWWQRPNEWPRRNHRNTSFAGRPPLRMSTVRGEQRHTACQDTGADAVQDSEFSQVSVGHESPPPYRDSRSVRKFASNILRFDSHRRNEFPRPSSKSLTSRLTRLCQKR